MQVLCTAQADKTVINKNYLNQISCTNYCIFFKLFFPKKAINDKLEIVKRRVGATLEQGGYSCILPEDCLDDLDTQPIKMMGANRFDQDGLDTKQRLKELLDAICDTSKTRFLFLVHFYLFSCQKCIYNGIQFPPAIISHPIKSHPRKNPNQLSI